MLDFWAQMWYTIEDMGKQAHFWLVTNIAIRLKEEHYADRKDLDGLSVH